MPRSRGYGDVTATYIRRSKIPSRTYTKHQYKEESEYGSTEVIYIPIEKCKYMVITESDTILQEYYITRKYKSIIHEEINKSLEVLTSNKRASRAKQERNWEEEPRRGPSFCYTPIVMEGSAAHSDQLQ